MSNQLITAGLLHKHAPIDIGDEDIKDAFYSQLQSTIKNVSPPDISIILADANALIASSSHDALEQLCVMGNTYIDHVTNDNGEHLLYCAT